MNGCLVADVEETEAIRQEVVRACRAQRLKRIRRKVSSGLVSFEEVKAMPPKFLWEPYLRLNNLNIVRGDGGAGKTMHVLAILAAITRGKSAGWHAGDIALSGV